MSKTVIVKGLVQDYAALAGILPPKRRERLNQSPPDPAPPDRIAELVERIHPRKIRLRIDSVVDEAPQVRTFRLVADPESLTRTLPVFRAGQYLSFKVEVDGNRIARPYSISSSPNDALDGFMEVTIRRKEGGFLTEQIWERWNAATKLEADGPWGFFYHDPIRDSDNMVGLAGGSGITPLRSMIRDIVQNKLDLNLTLLYGVADPTGIIFLDELDKLARESRGRVKVHCVCSEPDECWDGPTGFLTADCIAELAGGLEDKTLFICGPQAMYRFLEKELDRFKLRPKQIRREVFGEAEDPLSLPGFPQDKADETFKLKVHMGDESAEIEAAARETVLAALERAGLAPPSQCRSGECGYCNSLLTAGGVFVSPENDGRRMAVKKFGHFHPCSSYPVSDLEIRVMRGT